MYNQVKQKIIVKNSNGDIYFFYLDNNNTVIYERYSNIQVLVDTNILDKNPVIDFSVDIDKNDKVHVLCLTNEGKLMYYLYTKEKWSNSLILEFDTKSNKYSSLSLRINNDNLHIIYAYSNLISSSVWTIQHIMGVKNKWGKMNVISITTGKSAPYFIIDFDKFNNIHMIYKAKSNGKENIYYTSFNTILKKWNQFPQQISDLKSNIVFSYIFVDSKDNIHVVWYALINDELQLSYKHLSSIGRNQFRWKTENLPVHGINFSSPIIYEEKGLIKMLFNINNIITGIYSNDSGFTWRLDNEKKFKLTGAFEKVKYSSNFQLENNKYKVNDVLINVENFFIQLPYRFQNNDEKLKIERQNFSSIRTEQANQIKQFPINKSISILENLDEFKDELVKDFIISTKNSFETLNIKEDRIAELKAKVEKIIYDNSLCLDQKILHYNNYYNEIIAQLDNLQEILEQCKSENDTLLTLVDSVKEISLDRKNTVLSIESKINQIKDIISTESNRSILNKILNLFKKDI